MQDRVRGHNGFEIGLCEEEDRAEALAVFYQRVPGGLREAVIVQALEDGRRGEFDLGGFWIARRRGRILGVLLTQHQAGRTAAIWAPETYRTWSRTAVATELVRQALGGLRERGVVLAQALLEPTASRHAGLDLARGGVRRVTELCYLERTTEPPAWRRGKRDLPELEWVSYDETTDAAFREVLEATYLGSLDMPELEGIRSLDDVLVAHRASGRFLPAYWQLGRVPGEADASVILLLSGPSARSAWEVSYLGLTPGARGRGLGMAALEHALELARARSTRLELAVDVRNTPACRLYERAGFTAYDRRTVHLAVLG